MSPAHFTVALKRILWPLPPPPPLSIDNLTVSSQAGTRTAFTEDNEQITWTDEDKVKITYTSNNRADESSTVYFQYASDGTWKQVERTGESDEWKDATSPLLADAVETITKIETWGGNTEAPADKDQSTPEKYLAADYLNAEGSLAITYNEQTGAISASLSHAYTDIVITITEGSGETLPTDAGMTLYVGESSTGTNMYKSSTESATIFRAIADLTSHPSDNKPTIKAKLSNGAILSFTPTLPVGVKSFAGYRINVSATYHELQGLTIAKITIADFTDGNTYEITAGKDQSNQ